MIVLKNATNPHLKYGLNIYFWMSYGDSGNFSLISGYEYLWDFNLARFSYWQMTRKVIDSGFIKRYIPIKLQGFMEGGYRTEKIWPSKGLVKI